MWTGFFIQLLAQVGFLVSGLANMAEDINTHWDVANPITEAAWWSMLAGNEIIFFIAFLIWAIAFKKEPKYQKNFFKSMIWLSLIS